jgi:hypothetical protein
MNDVVAQDLLAPVLREELLADVGQHSAVEHLDGDAAAQAGVLSTAPPRRLARSKPVERSSLGLGSPRSPNAAFTTGRFPHVRPHARLTRLDGPAGAGLPSESLEVWVVEIRTAWACGCALVVLIAGCSNDAEKAGEPVVAASTVQQALTTSPESDCDLHTHDGRDYWFATTTEPGTRRSPNAKRSGSSWCGSMTPRRTISSTTMLSATIGSVRPMLRSRVSGDGPTVPSSGRATTMGAPWAASSTHGTAASLTSPAGTARRSPATSGMTIAATMTRSTFASSRALTTVRTTPPRRSRAFAVAARPMSTRTATARWVASTSARMIRSRPPREIAGVRTRPRPLARRATMACARSIPPVTGPVPAEILRRAHRSRSAR